MILPFFSNFSAKNTKLLEEPPLETGAQQVLSEEKFMSLATLSWAEQLHLIEC